MVGNILQFHLSQCNLGASAQAVTPVTQSQTLNIDKMLECTDVCLSLGFICDDRYNHKKTSQLFLGFTVKYFTYSLC